MTKFEIFSKKIENLKLGYKEVLNIQSVIIMKKKIFINFFFQNELAINAFKKIYENVNKLKKNYYLYNIYYRK